MLLLLLLKVLQSGFHLQAFLKVVECRILQTAIANKIVELMTSLYNIQIQNVIEANDVFFFQDSNVAIDVQVF